MATVLGGATPTSSGDAPPAPLRTPQSELDPHRLIAGEQLGSVGR
jgi:hypothetical protein